jgi:hypothetical protein
MTPLSNKNRNKQKIIDLWMDDTQKSMATMRYNRTPLPSPNDDQQKYERGTKKPVQQEKGSGTYILQPTYPMAFFFAPQPVHTTLLQNRHNKKPPLFPPAPSPFNYQQQNSFHNFQLNPFYMGHHSQF